MSSTVLLITEQFDPTADALIARLRDRHQPYFRWNLDGFPMSQALSLRLIDGRFRGTISADGHTVSLDEISSAWCRSFLPAGISMELEIAEQEFARDEARCAIHGLPIVTDWFWVNRPDRNRAAASKPVQLMVAHELGLETPVTLISNDPQEIRQFYDECGGDVIYKAFTQPMRMAPGKALFTSRLTPEHLQRLETIRCTPGIFQKYIPKAYEVRVTIVGEEVFAVEIDSQAATATREDWRIAPQGLVHRLHRLEAGMKEKLLRLARHFGLVYSAIDLIVTPDGRYVFLENNPGGQFGWLEAATGAPITDSLADALCQRITRNVEGGGKPRGDRPVSGYRDGLATPAGTTLDQTHVTW